MSTNYPDPTFRPNPLHVVHPAPILKILSGPRIPCGAAEDRQQNLNDKTIAKQNGPGREFIHEIASFEARGERGTTSMSDGGTYM